jgi:hypothetical protein
MNRSEFMSRVIGFEQSSITEKYYEQMTENIFLPEGFESEFAIFTSTCCKPQSESYSIDNGKVCELGLLSICNPDGFVEIKIEPPVDDQSLASSYDFTRGEVCVVIGNVRDLGQHVLVRCPGTLLRTPLTELGDRWKIDYDVCPTQAPTTVLSDTDRLNLVISDSKIRIALSRSPDLFLTSCSCSVGFFQSSRTLSSILDGGISKSRWHRQGYGREHCLQDLLAMVSAVLVCGSFLD